MVGRWDAISDSMEYGVLLDQYSTRLHISGTSAA